MGVRPLTAVQTTGLGRLVARGRLTEVPVDPSRASDFLRQAGEAVADIPNLRFPASRFNLAYDACHDVGEALLAAYGFRTTSGSGQHQALGEFLAIALPTPPASLAAQRFDTLRRIRNQQRYSAVPVGAAQAALAESAATDLVTVALAMGV